MTKSLAIKSSRSRIVALLMLSLTMMACDKIYDNDRIAPQHSTEQSYQYLNCTDYTQWVYIDLHTGDTATLSYEQSSLPTAWDIAIHRYDVKTNGGRAIETDFTDLDKLREAIADGTLTMPADDQWTADSEDSITVDMSHMMEGYLVRAASNINSTLCRWLNVDLSTMPPIYTPSGKVYLLLMSDGTMAAIRFTDFINPQLYSTKGYISLDYIYPISFDQ